MIWYKNTIIEVKQKHFNATKFFKDTIEYALMEHFEEAHDVGFSQNDLFICYDKGNILIKNELIVTDRPFKFIIEENPDDYWGTCTAKNLPCNRVPVQFAVAN